jgi:peptidoglycan/LPS O-acetylase OafA/YrhL
MATTGGTLETIGVPAAEGVRAQLGHIATVEGLRGVAVLWVVLFHFCVVRSTGASDPWIAFVDAIRPLAVVIRNGYLGVDLFFLITGFLLALPWFRNAARAMPPPSATAFYERRLRRIVPAYYVQLAFLFFVVLPLIRGLMYWRQDLGFLLFNLGAHATFLHYTSPITSASLSLNGPLWTLALEMQYYLLLPLIAPFFVRAPWRAALALILVAAAWRWLSFHDLEPLVRMQMALGSWWSIPEPTIRAFIASQLPGYLAHFALGILAGRAWLSWKDRAASPMRTAIAAGFAAASLALLYWLYAGGGAVVGEMSWLVSAIAMAAAMTAIVSTRIPVGNVLFANRPIQFVGRVSYSAYLYHLPLLMLANHFVPTQDGWAVFPAYVAGVLGVSWISWRFVERPFMKASTRG